jgi:hypothetical protein
MKENFIWAKLWTEIKAIFSSKERVFSFSPTYHVTKDFSPRIRKTVSAFIMMKKEKSTKVNGDTIYTMEKVNLLQK